MELNRKNWIITGIVSAVAIALTVLVGISVFNMTSHSAKEPVESDRESERSSDPVSESESEPAPDETDVPEGTTEEAPVPQENTLRYLTPEEIDAIRANYSAEERSYICSDSRNENGNPVDAVLFESRFREQFGDRVQVRNASGNVSITFVLTEEFEPNTEYMLNYLKDKSIRARFYTNYRYASDHPSIIRRILNEGHELGSIGYGLPDTGFASLTLSEQAKQLTEFHEYIYERYGVSMDRFFYFNSNYTDQSIALVTASGYDVCFYTVSYADYDHNKLIIAADFLDAMKTRLHSGAIYSFHTTNTASLLVVPELIDYARSLDMTVDLPDRAE